jgi:mevalonate kinase
LDRKYDRCRHPEEDEAAAAAAEALCLAPHGAAVLFGEHAVVFGHEALGIGVPHALTLKSLIATESGHRLSVPGWKMRADSENPLSTRDERVVRALEVLDGLLPGTGGIDLVVRARIPMGAGLGSSAALSVLLVAALAKRRSVGLTARELCRCAHELEKVFHGTPSGLDDSVAVYGGLCLFRRGGFPPQVAARLGIATSADERVPLALPRPPLVVAHSGVPRSTAALVARVRERREREPAVVGALFDAMDDCLADGLAALRAGDLPRLGGAMTRNHELLRTLGVSCPALETLVARARAAGALGAKLTGAGGGGAVLALLPAPQGPVAEALHADGFVPLGGDLLSATPRPRTARPPAGDDAEVR